MAATPAATPLSVRAPEVPAILTEVPPVWAPTVMAPVPGAPPVCWMRPVVPLATLVERAETPLELVLSPVEADVERDANPAVLLATWIAKAPVPAPVEPAPRLETAEPRTLTA